MEVQLGVNAPYLIHHPLGYYHCKITPKVNIHNHLERIDMFLVIQDCIRINITNFNVYIFIFFHDLF